MKNATDGVLIVAWGLGSDGTSHETIRPVRAASAGGGRPGDAPLAPPAKTCTGADL